MTDWFKEIISKRMEFESDTLYQRLNPEIHNTAKFSGLYQVHVLFLTSFSDISCVRL